MKPPRSSRAFCARLCSLVSAAALLLPGLPARAVDFTNGVMTAVPTPNGKAPVIDGKLDDWDLSCQEPVYISTQTIETMNAEWAAMYDDDALYLSAKVTMPGRGIFNPNNPQDAFWNKDILQVRMCSDPGVPYPLDGSRDWESQRVEHVSFWKNHLTGQSFVHINRGADIKRSRGETVMPPGAQVEIRETAADGHFSYTMEAKLPWAALNADGDKLGGRNPFKAGQGAAFAAETLWIGGDKSRVILCYRRNPGVFAFSSPDSWGKLVYAAQSPGKRVRPTMAQVIAETRQASTPSAPKVGVPFTVEVPGDGLKVSVNIFDEHGGVIREIIGAEPHPKGPLTVHWDGRNAFNKPLPPGNYKWGAYFHKPLAADYQGGVGATSHPYYKTLDGTGGWGGDHTNPIDAAAGVDTATVDGKPVEKPVLYLLWPTGEAGVPLVKTDLKGKVIWRKNPFVGGGFGPFYAVATDNQYVYLSRTAEDKVNRVSTVYLSRLKADDASLLTWGERGPAEVAIASSPFVFVPQGTTPLELVAWGKEEPYPAGKVRQPDSTGMVVRDGKVWIGSYGAGKIFVVNAATGKTESELDCPGVRGLAFDVNGDLLAVTYLEGKGGQVVKFAKGAGQAVPVITEGLEAPHGVAQSRGVLWVSDCGASQQVKGFIGDGKRADKSIPMVKAIGKPGGRPQQGTYDPATLDFINPAGLAVDAEGALIVTESSAPKTISRLEIQDVGSGKTVLKPRLLDRWYGAGVYWNSTWPMPEEPENAFYLLNDAVARARVAGPDGVGVPNAFWVLEKAGYPHVGNMETGLPQPEVLRATNGRLYFAKDSGTHMICLVQGPEQREEMRPLATWKFLSRNDKANPSKTPTLIAWIDANGDGQEQDNEVTRITELPDGKPLPALATTTSSLHMEPNGDLYLMTHENCILKIPAAGFEPDGRVKWELGKMRLAVPTVMPGLAQMHTTYRQGLLGARVDAAGNIYTLFNTRLTGSGGDWDYPTTAIAAKMRDGMGHTASFNVIKFAKFDKEGRLLWMAGRKATAGAAPGEMYHFWNMAGLANDRYIAGGSEWGQIYLYTHDGFFVDALMNNPGEVTPPGPYTFGGETSGGRVAYFPKTGKLWAYSSGMVYKVNGFSDGQVEGESRASGTVALDKTYHVALDDAAAKIPPLELRPLPVSPLADAGKAWKGVPFAELATKTGTPIARAWLGYDAENLYVNMSVIDDTPLQNGATEEAMVFKQGDTAGIVLGPNRPGEAEEKADPPRPGDIRLMAVQMGESAKLIAMKPFTKLQKQPQEYFTPAGGKHLFEFVGEVPGGQVRLQKTKTGYNVLFAVPRSFLELEIAPDKLKGDVEVRLSGAGQRGLQAVSRNYLFTPDRVFTKMTDDLPTEARLYPEFWGPVEVK